MNNRPQRHDPMSGSGQKPKSLSLGVMSDLPLIGNIVLRLGDVSLGPQTEVAESMRETATRPRHSAPCPLADPFRGFLACVNVVGSRLGTWGSVMFDLRRRGFVALLAGAVPAWPIAAPAEQPVKRIAYLAPSARGTENDPITQAFEQGLRQRGWVPGQNIAIEYRFTGGRQDAVAPIVAEIAALKLDAIVAWSPPLALAMKRATQVPLVFLITFDPIEVGLVSNLAAPEGNVTGVTSLASLEILAKRLQLLQEVAPSLRSVAVLLSTEQIRSRGGHDALIAAARGLNLELQDVEVTTPADLDAAIRKVKEERAEALYVWPSGFAFSFGKQIADLAKVYRMPSLHPFREGALAGGLMAYSADLKQSAQLGAEYISRILSGTPPSNLPVQQLSKYDLLVNLKTAKALDLTVPPSLLARADEVIE